MEELLGWNFPINIDKKTGKIKMTDLQSDIRQSILILLNTTKGERLAHPTYGCNLNRFIFEPIDYTLINQINQEVLSAINLWENRVENVDIEVLNDVENETRLIININYTIKQTNQNDSLNYVFNLSDNN